MFLTKVLRRIPFTQIILVMFALACIAYPIVSNCINIWIQNNAITEMVAEQSKNPEQMRKKLLECQDYNNILAGNADAGEDSPKWEDLIDVIGKPIASIEFPSFGQNIPIYKGSGNDALMSGAGLLENSSMPVGGASTHALISGHSGMPGNRMFDDLEQFEPGDIFLIHVLGETLAYKVYSKEVVTPDDTRSFAIQEGRDLCTLITCTPYTINTHRLLIHGERTMLSSDFEPDGFKIDQHRIIPMLLVGAVIIGGILLLFFKLRARPRQLGIMKIKTDKNGKLVKVKIKHRKHSGCEELTADAEERFAIRYNQRELAVHGEKRPGILLIYQWNLGRFIPIIHDDEENIRKFRII